MAKESPQRLLNVLVYSIEIINIFQKKVELLFNKSNFLCFYVLNYIFFFWVL